VTAVLAFPELRAVLTLAKLVAVVAHCLMEEEEDHQHTVEEGGNQAC
jgi:hypothetical protein